MKPVLTRHCPLCGGPMSWCGDVPTEDEPDGHHPCHQITCTRCKFNVDFHDAESQSIAEFDDLLRHIAAKWNGADGVLETKKPANPIETVQYWAEAYADPASGEHFSGHGMVVQLLREYLALRKRLLYVGKVPFLVPEDWQLVPIDPTTEMCLADWNVGMSDAHSDTGVSACVWAAMLAAAPRYEPEEDEDVEQQQAARIHAPEIADAARVIEWARSNPRRPANSAFTAGAGRQAAYWIEWAEQNMTRAAAEPEVLQKALSALEALHIHTSKNMREFVGLNWAAQMAMSDLRRLIGPAAITISGEPPAGGCSCETCMPIDFLKPETMRMILCSICGNKRCPHATDHRNACTNSNEPGQKGSSWENYKLPGAGNTTAPTDTKNPGENK